MTKRYRNIFISGTGKVWYNYYVGKGSRLKEVTEQFYLFSGNYDPPTEDVLDVFIFEYELATGLKPYEISSNYI